MSCDRNNIVINVIQKYDNECLVVNGNENMASKIVEMRTKFRPELYTEDKYSKATKTNWTVKKI